MAVTRHRAEKLTRRMAKQPALTLAGIYAKAMLVTAALDDAPLAMSLAKDIVGSFDFQKVAGVHS